ncbi:MAG: holo-ACP synthase [Desulfovibrionaceae bacterium]|nr:holo-ACP synthase [Desulfovibrionaceae bacterium]
MILGTGTDITTLARISRGLERFGSRFARRILDDEEMAVLPEGPGAAAFLAGRWAAKEACAKALGTGFAMGIGPSDMRVFNNALGAPYLDLKGPAKARFEELGCARAHVSISHDRESAIAFVILEGD